MYDSLNCIPVRTSTQHLKTSFLIFCYKMYSIKEEKKLCSSDYSISLKMVPCLFSYLRFAGKSLKFIIEILHFGIKHDSIVLTLLLLQLG
jgi:hypothetical protein